MNVISRCVLLILILFLTSSTGIALKEVTLNEYKGPQSAVLLIVDGLGSSYFYPEFSPFAADGSILMKANASNLLFRARIKDIRTEHPSTGIAHSVIITGFSDANEEIAGFPDATIYDITKKHGFINLAIMEKGDFENMKNEQDIILFAENNSIDKPLIAIQSHNPPQGIYDLMYEWKMKLPSYLEGKKGAEKYSVYNSWAIEAGNALALFMIRNHPSQRFFLTINIGAIDSIGHSMGPDDYVKLIERLDSDIYTLYDTANNNDIALFLTADHGMSFISENAQRGGHSSEKYSEKIESQRLPFLILSRNTVNGMIEGEYKQEDIAPTLLSVLDLPDHLRFSDGDAVKVKSYATIFVKSDLSHQISLWNNGRKISEQTGSEFIFRGLPLNSSYVIKASGDDGTFEEEGSLDSDKHIEITEHESAFNISSRGIIAIILILIVNIAGFVIIWMIKDGYL